jgi:hypothetical protein
VPSFGGPKLEIDVAGLDATTAMLRDAAARGEDMRPAMEQIKALLIEGHKEQFATKGAFLGTPWPTNSAETLARKARTGVASLASTMVESGDLQQSLEGGTGSRSRVSRGSVSVGTSLFYAIFAMKGTDKGEPARPPIGINDAEANTALSIMTDYLLAR